MGFWGPSLEGPLECEGVNIPGLTLTSEGRELVVNCFLLCPLGGESEPYSVHPQRVQCDGVSHAGTQQRPLIHTHLHRLSPLLCFSLP